MKGKRVLKKQKQQSNPSLLGTYFVSLFSVLLSFIMLLGTTFAWFYTDNTSLGNEIRSGSLKVDMLHVTEGGDKKISLAEHDDHPVFSSDDKWTPDRSTQTEIVEIVNTGNVMLDYKLDFVPISSKESTGSVAELFTVYVDGVEAGRLDNFLSDAHDETDDFCLAARQGMAKDEVHSIQIELRMRPGAAYGAMGQSVPVYLKLVAYQHLTGLSE